MNRDYFYSIMNGQGKLDYEVYLNTFALLRLQKDFNHLCNHDELQFQIVHQTEELWMKLIVYTLLDIGDFLKEQNTLRVLTLFKRVHQIQNNLLAALPVLETMSPKEYQEIRIQLGNGSGQESPGFRTLLQLFKPLWELFKTYYLDANGLTVKDIYHTHYNHSEAYVVAEALVEFEELFRKFRYHHIQLINRSIGMSSHSLKGRSVDLLKNGLESVFFPELWEIRNKMTNEWGGEYGVVRDSIAKQTQP
jgi:tryptophan 2,3-dioxygenase